MTVIFLTDQSRKRKAGFKTRLSINMKNCKIICFLCGLRDDGHDDGLHGHHGSVRSVPEH